MIGRSEFAQPDPSKLSLPDASISEMSIADRPAVISDSEADLIYKKLRAETESQNALNMFNFFKKIIAISYSHRTKMKKKWRDDESKLLQWAVQRITKARGLSSTQLVCTFFQNVQKNPLHQRASDWEDIAGLVPGRNESQCRYRWAQTQEKQGTKVPWSAKEDQMLKSLMETEPGMAWSILAEKLNSMKFGTQRSGKQCRERWRNHLDPEIKKEPWTDEEDCILLEAQLMFGNKWSEIAKKLPGRCENSVKNRFNMLYKKYGVDQKTSGILDVTEAFHVVNEEKKMETEWIHRLIREKRSKKPADPKPVAPAPTPTAKKPTALKGLKASLFEMTKAEFIENPGDYTCPNHRYLNKMRQRTEEVRSKSERFVNPKTGQELFFTDLGIYVYNDKGFLIPLRDMIQIQRKHDILHAWAAPPKDLSDYSWEKPSPPIQQRPLPEPRYEAESPFSAMPSMLYRNSPLQMSGGDFAFSQAITPPSLLGAHAGVYLVPPTPNTGTTYIAPYEYTLR